MCDLNWCPICDKAISCESNSLYCSNTCFSKDCSSHSSHNFQSFFASKPSSIAFNKQLLLIDEAPSLAYSSLYTNSTSVKSFESSSSLFTTRDAYITTKLNNKNQQKQDDLSCCDYCQNMDKKNTGLISLF